MMNPWEELELEYYEGHMQSENVYQAQSLNLIMKDQFNCYPVKSICILGVSGGNGLEHINANDVSKIFGLDINNTYLKICHRRFHHLKDVLELIHSDLTLEDARIPHAEIIVANLIIEYLGIETFKRLIERSNVNYISCVIQINDNNFFVSSSLFEKYFHKIECLHNDIDKEQLVIALQSIGFDVILSKEYKMPNNKVLFRLDFKSRI